MGSLSLTHLLVLVVILLLFFGPSRLPQLGQSIGRAIKGFKEGLNGDGDSKTGERSVTAKRDQLSSGEGQHSSSQEQSQRQKDPQDRS